MNSRHDGKLRVKETRMWRTIFDFHAYQEKEDGQINKMEQGEEKEGELLN